MSDPEEEVGSETQETLVWATVILLCQMRTGTWPLRESQNLAPRGGGGLS